jgi:predicted DsbA family dithiol-disulfide isomerase
VTPAFLQAIAQQIPGLDLAKWSADTQKQSLQAQLTKDGQAASAHGFVYTPTIVVEGPKGQATPIQSLPASYSAITSEINQVS